MTRAHSFYKASLRNTVLLKKWSQQRRAARKLTLGTIFYRYGIRRHTSGTVVLLCAHLCSVSRCGAHPPRVHSCHSCWPHLWIVTLHSLQPTFNLIFPPAFVHKAPSLSSNFTCLNWFHHQLFSHKPCWSTQFLLLLDSVSHLSLKSHSDFDPAFMSCIQTFAKSLHLFFFFTRLFLPIFLYPLDYYSEYYKTHNRFKINIHKLELSKFLQQDYK